MQLSHEERVYSGPEPLSAMFVQCYCRVQVTPDILVCPRAYVASPFLRLSVSLPVRQVMQLPRTGTAFRGHLGLAVDVWRNRK